MTRGCVARAIHGARAKRLGIATAEQSADDASDSTEVQREFALTRLTLYRCCSANAAMIGNRAPRLSRQKLH